MTNSFEIEYYMTVVESGGCEKCFRTLIAEGVEFLAHESLKK